MKLKMVEGTVRLLARRGLHATSFSEVLELTGAPRGSVYHHFPEGKEQLIREAVAFAGARSIQLLESKAGATALEITEFFLNLWRELLSRSNFQVGCAVLAVTVAADSPVLLSEAAAAFRAWRKRLAELLDAGGLGPTSAAGLAATLIAACEGAVVLSRAEQSMEPFDLVAVQMSEHVRTLLKARSETIPAE
jgi:AcrR family transcriptional regulator